MNREKFTIPTPEVEELITQVLHDEPVHSGGNSLIRKALWRGQPVAIKDYTRRSDGRLRATREWSALNFLSNSASRWAPQPFAISADHDFVVMEWIDGSTPHETLPVDSMIEILADLHHLAECSSHSSIMSAADAIDSPNDLYVQTRQRLTSLGSSDLVAQEAQELSDFVATRDPFGSDAADKVATLSPSDFGPHNMLWDGNGYRLIDLEFFGWDDAHKLAADTSLHPLIPWTHESLTEFQEGATSLYRLDSGRLREVTQGALIKWAAIILARAEREWHNGSIESHRSSVELARSYRQRAIELSA